MARDEDRRVQLAERRHGPRGALLLVRPLVFAAALGAEAAGMNQVELPLPRTEGPVSVEAALAARRSVRDYGPGALQLTELAQLAWAAQGVTSPQGLRTAPSAGALYPLELRILVGRVDGLDPGIYRYRPEAHVLVRESERDPRSELAAAAHGQDWVREGAAVAVFSGIERRTAVKYGPRAERYVQVEAGHAAQNLFLQATALGLATVVVGAFDDGRVRRVLALEAGETPLLIMPLGRPP
jgi:SagB-type dehydrogenase family enzyme